MSREGLCLEGFFQEGGFGGYFALVTAVERYDGAFCDLYFDVEAD